MEESRYSHIDKTFFNAAIKVIYENKHEFEVYAINNEKLRFVKALKNYIPGSGLKECKDIIDLYFLGELPLYIKESRMKKIEELGKLPIIDKFIDRFRSMNDNEIRTLLLKFSVEQLLTMEDFINNQNE